MNNNIDQCILNLRFDHPLSRNVEAKDLRGAIANRNRDKTVFHQHTLSGELIYKYPLVQYKIIKGKGFLIGFSDGAEAIANLEILREEFELHGERYLLLQNEIRFCSTSIGVTKEFLSYHFLSPWVALNEENYRRYHRTEPGARKSLLAGILIGNILSMAKGVRYLVTEEIKAHVDVHEVPVKLKGLSMVGFLGDFKVNFEIPDYSGLGKSVSRGFGTVLRKEATSVTSQRTE